MIPPTSMARPNRPAATSPERLPLRHSPAWAPRHWQRITAFLRDSDMYCWQFLAAAIFLLGSLVTDLHAAPLESFLLFFSNNVLGETEPCG